MISIIIILLFKKSKTNKEWINSQKSKIEIGFDYEGVWIFELGEWTKKEKVRKEGRKRKQIELIASEESEPIKIGCCIRNRMSWQLALVTNSQPCHSVKNAFDPLFWIPICQQPVDTSRRWVIQSNRW